MVFSVIGGIVLLAALLLICKFVVHKVTIHPTAAADLSTITIAIQDDRSFSSSNFKVLYNNQTNPKFQHEVFSSLQAVIARYCLHCNIVEAQPDDFFTRLQRQAMQPKHVNELLDDVQVAVTRLWTSSLTMNVVNECGGGVANLEFCSILNHCLRIDALDLLTPAVLLVRAITNYVSVSRDEITLAFPPNAVCFRGGGLPDQHKDFFQKGISYRQPAFLATSFSEKTAQRFLVRASDAGYPPVKWVVHLDPRGESDLEYRCKHVRYIEKSNIAGEEEFLFVPYSVFTVKCVEWQHHPTSSTPHIIHLEAAIDNRIASENLPLCPWS